MWTLNQLLEEKKEQTGLYSQNGNSCIYTNISQIGTNILHYIEQRSHQKQPSVLALGSALHPDQVFVVCDSVAVECNSLLKGVDVCFKAMFVLWVEYPWQAKNIWDFIQKVVFELGDERKPGARELHPPAPSL